MRGRAVVVKDKRETQKERGKYTGFPLVLWILAVVLILNGIVLYRSLQVWEFEGRLDDVEASRLGAYSLADFFGQQASRRGVEKNQAVRDSLARLRYEIAQAATVQEVGAALSRHGIAVESVLAREEEEQNRQKLAEMISQDPQAARQEDIAIITVGKDDAGNVVVEDPGKVLTADTREKIEQDRRARQLTGILTVQVSKGRAAVVTSRSLEGELESLRQENEQIKTELRQVQQVGGYAPLTGAGLIIRAVAAEGQEEQLANTLGYDVRDIINELFAAGASGVEIGGQRLITTSSVRSVADRLLVNQQPVDLRPLVIKAVGDSQVLASSLDLLLNAPFFSLDLDLEEKDSVTLVAYKPRG